MTITRTMMTTACLAASMSLGGLAHADIANHPDDLVFEALDFDPPASNDFRYTLSNGVTVFLAPSSELPLVNIAFTFKGGTYLEPADHVGLASMTGGLIRSGGTSSLSPQELDEQLDFLAAEASASIGGTRSSASLNTLRMNLDESMKLFMDMVRNPGFNDERFRVRRDQMVEGMRQRNDDASSILAREWNALMYGRDHFEARVPTKETIDAISIDDMRELHAKIFNPANLIIAVNGDFEPSAMLDRLEQACAGWTMGERVGDPPAPAHTPTPGVYHVEKDIPQGKVRMGMRGMKRDDPDQIATDVMNDILGGGGFTSRIMRTVRSDEGLAYGARSSFQHGVYYPGEFSCSVESKNATVALAIKLMQNEIKGVRNELVTDGELETTKNSFVETFPRRFESKARMLGTFVDDEMTGRDTTYWDSYRDQVTSTTLEDVRRVASTHLQPDNMIILVVGKWDEIAPGDIHGEGRASMQDFFNGEVEHLPLRDPLTQEPVK